MDNRHLKTDMIDIQHLSFRYPHYKDVGQERGDILKDISLKVSLGERVLIIAPPDSGKTTLAKILMRGIPTYGGGELQGSITVDNINILEEESYNVMESITYIGQNPQEQLLMNTCEDEISFPLEAIGYSKEEISKRVLSSLERWGLKEHVDVHPQELSGGERKRLLLAVSDAIDAKVWILDEIFDDLDAYYKQKLMSYLLMKEGCSITFASRFLPEFNNFFQTLYTITDGRLVEVGQIDVIEVQQEKKSEQITPTQKRLCLKDGVIIHPRRSVKSDNIFTLNVDNFYVSQHEIVALVGPNGSGKSTLSRSLCGLDPLHQGSVTIGGKSLSPVELKESVGYLFQNPDYFLFLPTVLDELTFSLRNDFSLSKQEKKEIAIECASKFQLSLRDNPTMMSYGERKRLQAAVYYLLSRPFLIIDEIDSGITYNQAYEIIKRYKETECGIIIISHDASFASSVAHRTYEIKDNHVVLRTGSGI